MPAARAARPVAVSIYMPLLPLVVDGTKKSVREKNSSNFATILQAIQRTFFGQEILRCEMKRIVSGKVVFLKVTHSSDLNKHRILSQENSTQKVFMYALMKNNVF